MLGVILQKQEYDLLLSQSKELFLWNEYMEQLDNDEDFKKTLEQEADKLGNALYAHFQKYKRRVE